MLPKSKRVPRASFGPLIEARGGVHGEHFSLKYAEAPSFRAAVSVSKKVSKSAVTRNRVRRRVYGVLASFASKMKNGLYLIVSKPGADKTSHSELEAEVTRLFSKFLIS